MATSENETKLIEQIMHRDEKALHELIRTYRPQLSQFIFKQLSDRQVAEELTQDVFLDFIESLRDFHYQCSIKTFLFAIAKNKIIDTIRKKKIKRILFSSMPLHIIEGMTVVFDEDIEHRELSSKISHVLDKLPNDYQLVLRLKYIDGEKVKTISDKLSLGFKATESLIFRARKAFVKLFLSMP